MKKIILGLLCLTPFFSYASDEYTKNMEVGIKELFTVRTIDELQVVANKFDRIASVETEEWLPSYYASLAHIWMATREPDNTKKDQWLDEAQSRLSQVYEKDDSNSEIVALQGFIYMLKLTVDPATRGATYSQKAFMEFTKATQLDSLNPRALFFRGQMEFGTAQFFQTDTSPACQTMAKSLELFDNFTPRTSIYPDWGKGFAEKTVHDCSQNAIEE